VPASISDGTIIPALSIPSDYTQSGAEADHGHCTEIAGTGGKFLPGKFVVTAIQEGQGYAWHSKEELDNLVDQYHEYWHTARVDYQVTCGNKITYAGVKFLRSESWTCNEAREYLPGYKICKHNDYHALAPVPLSHYNATTGDIGGYEKEVVLSESDLLTAWNGHDVELPRYYGGLQKLNVPVIFVNSPGFDYRAWGIVPAGEKGSAAWTAGLVSDYQMGSLPDVMARAYGLKKGADINNNGLYFLNIDKSLLADRESAIAGFMQRVSQIMINHVSISSNLQVNFQLDIVCQGAGCLLVREAIAQGANYNPALLGINLNPINCIRRIVTVDAPNLGSGLAKNQAQMGTWVEYGGLPTLLNHMDASLTGIQPTGQDKVLNMSVELDYSSIMWELSDGPLAFYAWFEGQIVDVSSTIAGIFGYSFDSINVSLSGGLFGPHKIHWKADEKLQGDIDNSALVSTGQSLQSLHTQAVDLQASWLSQLTSVDYPRKPNGEYIELVPFYSDDVTGVAQAMLKEYANESFGTLCLGIADVACKDIQTLATENLKQELEKVIGTVESANVGVEPWLNQEMIDLGSGWLSHSDLVVEKSSQVWGMTDYKFDGLGQVITQLHPAKTYAIHFSEFPVGHPDRPVVHGSFENIADANNIALPVSLAFTKKGAPQMGRDLFCALDDNCSTLLANGNNVIYMGPATKQSSFTIDPNTILQDIWTQVQNVVGNFNLSAQILSGDQAGIVIKDANGNTLGALIYTQATGTLVWQSGTTTNTITNPLSAPVRPQFALRRVGTQVIGTVITQDGKSTDYVLATTNATTLSIYAIGNELNQYPALLLGTATPANPAATQPSSIAYGDVKSVVQERGASENNQSRPWMWLVNKSNTALHNLTMTYYFTADPLRNPVAEIDYPTNISYSIKNVVGDFWALQIKIAELPAKSVAPSNSGLQVRLHYQDWTSWIKEDDYSVGTGLKMPTERVVVHDAQGRLIWGQEPPDEIFNTATVTQMTPMQLQVTFADGGKNELNMIRPRLTMQHLGGVALEPGYQVLLYVNGIGTGVQAPTLEDYYSPDCQGSIERVGNDGILVRWTFNSYRLYNGQQVGLGDWGIHWADWKAIAKSGLDSAKIVVVDAQGNVVFGTMPTILPVTPESIPQATVTASFADGGAYESNLLRPRITVTNTGAVSLASGYTIHAYIYDYDTRNGALPILEQYYSANYVGSEHFESNGILHVTWTSQGYDLLSGQSVELGDWGIHWGDWTALDKSQTASTQVVVTDAQNRVIFGTLPIGATL